MSTKYEKLDEWTTKYPSFSLGTRKLAAVLTPKESTKTVVIVLSSIQIFKKLATGSPYHGLNCALGLTHTYVDIY
jgi:hypothetical protein